MALARTGWGYPNGWLRRHCSRQRQEKEAEMQWREAVVRCSSCCSWVGAIMRMASAYSSRVATDGRALFIPLAATMPQNVVRSRSSRSALVSDVSIPLSRAHRNAADLAWRRPTKAMIPQAKESLDIILSSKSQRTSSPKTPTLVTTTTAISCTPCTVRARSWPLGGT
jgi:hypothetical protein